MSWWQGLDGPEAVLEALEAYFHGLARRVLARYPDFDHLDLYVAQYWNDQATDAVHSEVVLAAEGAPPGPHTCDTTPYSVCMWCDAADPLDLYAQLDAFDWDGEHADLKRAIEPYCPEGANQTMDLHEGGYQILLRATAAGVAWIGDVIRPWLLPDRVPISLPAPEVAPLFEAIYARPHDDGPRLVLADLLQSRGDPRGRFMALQLQPDPTAAMHAEAETLWATHRQAWLGRFVRVAAPLECEATRGVVSTLAFATPGGVDAERRDAILNEINELPEWSTIERVVLDEDRGCTLLPVMQTVPIVEAPDSALASMARFGAWQCTTFQTDGYQPEALAALDLPCLETLILTWAQAVRPLHAARWWPQLQRIEIQAALPAAIADALRHPTASVSFDMDLSNGASVRGDRTAPQRLRLVAQGLEKQAPESVDPLKSLVGAGWRVEVQGLRAEQRRRLMRESVAEWVAI